MSPRAACRLERLGFHSVYDYTAGKADWLAAGLPTEGTPRRARVLAAADRHPPTCGPDEIVTEVVARLVDIGRTSCAVIDDNKVVLGRLRVEHGKQTGDQRVESVMDPGPTTVRADADLDETRERMRGRRDDSLLVTTPEGLLLGELHPNDDTRSHRR